AVRPLEENASDSPLGCDGLRNLARQLWAKDHPLARRGLFRPRWKAGLRQARCGLGTIMRAKVAVAGAGIYGATIAIRLAEQGHNVRLFDPLGILRGASAINQFRIHSGYHYPRSPETITETLEARAEFTAAFAP